MSGEFLIKAQDGAISIGAKHLIVAGQLQAEVEVEVAPWVKRARDHRNGYEWLDLGDLTFGGHSAVLTLCFKSERLQQAAWGLALTKGLNEGDWPTRGAIDEEISIVRGVLAREVGFAAIKSCGTLSLPWGNVWSVFDKKGFNASNGLCYHPL